MRFLAALAIGLAILVGQAAAAAQPEHIYQAAASGGRLWFTDHTGLWSADLEGRAVTNHVPDHVSGLAKGDTTVWIARVEGKDPDTGKGGVMRAHPILSGGGLGSAVLTVAMKRSERFKSIFLMDGEVFLLTTRRLFSTKQRQQIGEPLTIKDASMALWERGYPNIPGLMTGSVVPKGSRGEVYLGFDAGEFGGGVWRVDVRESTISPIRSTDARDPCDRMLDPGCSQGQALKQDPDHDACVLAAVALRHFFELGGIVRICPTGVAIVHRQALKENSRRAFYGLAPSQRGFWAASFWEVLKFEEGKVASRTRLDFRVTEGGLALARVAGGFGRARSRRPPRRRSGPPAHPGLDVALIGGLWSSPLGTKWGSQCVLNYLRLPSR